jgi:hypothetical protein
MRQGMTNIGQSREWQREQPDTQRSSQERTGWRCPAIHASILMTRKGNTQKTGWTTIGTPLNRKSTGPVGKAVFEWVGWSELTLA